MTMMRLPSAAFDSRMARMSPDMNPSDPMATAPRQ